MLDSPFERCPVCGECVLLDQTQRQCAREHGCAEETPCPLARWFTGVEFGAPDRRAKPREPRPR
jgi:hypothetical protein